MVAHLALNAEGMARALARPGGRRATTAPRTMYDSDDAARRRHRRPGRRRRRARSATGCWPATTILNDAVAAVPDGRVGGRVERTPGGRSMRAASLPGHAAARARDPPRRPRRRLHDRRLVARRSPSTCCDAMTKRLDPTPSGSRCGRSTPTAPGSLGAGRRRPVAVVTGPAADLGWWLTGRPAPETLSCSRGELPDDRRLVTHDDAERLHRRGLPRRRARPAYRGIPGDHQARRRPADVTTTATSCAAPTPATRCSSTPPTSPRACSS